RLVERSKTGEEAVWGEVLAWEPPGRIAFTWHPGYAEGDPMTEVEVRFRAQGGLTVVELEHRGWERLGERAEEARTGYEVGWPVVLGRYAAAV
ncbi:MAG TPA: SRPBCC domain-containing protein, partial [Gaiellaceae bacterium]